MVNEFSSLVDKVEEEISKTLQRKEQLEDRPDTYANPRNNTTLVDLDIEIVTLGMRYEELVDQSNRMRGYYS